MTNDPQSSGSRDVKERILGLSVDVAVRLAVVALLAIWCFQIFRPFILPIVGGIIIAVALAKPFDRLVALVGGRRGIAATIFALTAVLLVVVPTFQVVDSVVRSSAGLAEQLEAETLHVPPVQEGVRDWPLVGDRIYDAWSLASTNFSAAVERFTPQLKVVGSWSLVKVRGLLGAVLHAILALIIAGFMLAYGPGGVKAVQGVMLRLAGSRGAKMVPMIGATIRSVALGVLGIAMVQAALGGLGMFLVHVPAWGLWTLLILFFAVMQLPPLLVLGPVIFWAFSALDSMAITIVFSIWCVVVSFSDTFLKPLFLGRGLDVPMPVILIGAIGGLILYGLIGLFVGAVVLAVGYEMFQAWMGEDGAGEPGAPSDVASEATEPA